MFSNRQLLVYLLITWALLLMRTNPFEGDQHRQTALKVKQLFPELSARIPDLARIEISDIDSKVVLELPSEDSPYSSLHWLVRDKRHPADRAKLMFLINAISELRGIDLVSIRKSSHEVYGVSEGDGTRVQMFDKSGALIVDWIAGAIRSQDIVAGDHPVFEYYMRRTDSDEVYLSGGAIQPSSDSLDWCDVKFLQGIDADQIDAIARLDYQTKTRWKISRVNSAAQSADSQHWRVIEPEGFVVSNFAGDSMAFSCSNLHASDVISMASTEGADNAKYGFPLDKFIVEISGQELEFEFGNPAREGHRYMRVSGLQHIYTISDFEVGQLRQNLESLSQE